MGNVSKMTRVCLLKCINDSHPPIELPHLLKIFLGRSKQTAVTDPNCSRQQISFEANCDKCTVKVIPHGLNASGLNGFSLKKDVEYIVRHGAHIELLLNEHIHKIAFDPPPDVVLVKSELYDIEKKKISQISEQPQKRKAEDYESTNKRSKPIDMSSSSINDEIKTAVGKEGEPAGEDKWETIDNGLLHIFTAKNVRSRSQIASYDLDGTLIKTKSGKVFPQNTDDWQLAFSEVPNMLKKFHSSGYKVLIFTNQAGIGSGKVRVKDFKRKLENIVSRIGVPIQAFVSTGKGVYRKPAIGMWEALTQMKNDDIEVDISNSFYCGDAAGRIANWAPGKKKDHSLADRLWAENLKLKFSTPESHFQKIPEVTKWSKPEFDPKTVAKVNTPNSLLSDKKEIVVLVGFPGSGKSIVAKKLEKDSKYKYKIVCRDTLGSWQKCASSASSYLDAGKSVIVDSTNPDIESRGRWIELAKQKSVPCRCFNMVTTLIHSKHNNRFRELTDTTHAVVTDMVYHGYKKKYAEPTAAEGFSEILEVPFVPDFENEAHEKLYHMNLLEK